MREARARFHQGWTELTEFHEFCSMPSQGIFDRMNRIGTISNERAANAILFILSEILNAVCDRDRVLHWKSRSFHPAVV
jgi:hypothetical protein